MPRRSRPKRTFGHVEQVQPSGRYRARFTGPDLKRHTAPGTFDTYGDAEAWLNAEHARILVDPEGWLPPRDRIRDAQTRRMNELTFSEYATKWLALRTVKGRPLATRTREGYQSMLDRLLFPTFGALTLRSISPELVNEWYQKSSTPEGKPLSGRPKLRADAYILMKSILSSAADPAQTGGALIRFNPCSIRGAGKVERASETNIATSDELDQIAAAMPARFRLMVLIAGWCSLRSGEVRELRRGDVDTTTGIVRVSRQVVRTRSGMVVSSPKSTAGVRVVVLPKSLLPDLRRHLLEHAQQGADGLLFPSATGHHLPPVTLSETFDAARRAAGRPDLRFHDLRHTGLTYAAQAGATLAELKAWGGHSTVQAALVYQQATADRKQLLADRLDAMRGGAITT